jgi:hypothetical protein
MDTAAESGLCRHRYKPTWAAEAIGSTGSCATVDRDSSKAQTAEANAEDTHIGTGSHPEEVARRCVFRGLRHLERAVRLSPGWYDSYSQFGQPDEADIINIFTNNIDIIIF